MKEILKYSVEDERIAELLGLQNFTNQESAILELVKNAFDALATKCEITFYNDCIYIKDNGCGMTDNDIKNNWMCIGKSNKGYEIFDENDHKRILAGSKGIGRFALSRLGARISVFSQKNDFETPNVKYDAVIWRTNWNKTTLQKIDNTSIKGTEIYISLLRDKWTDNSIKKLSRYLSRTYNNSVMLIYLKSGDNRFEDILIYKYFKEPILGFNTVSKIHLEYNAITTSLNCNVENDEFLPEAKQYCSNININSLNKTINLCDELINSDDIDLENDELKETLNKLGDFNAEFYFSLKTTTERDQERFLYKYTNLYDRYEPGIILYRNAFSISSYDGSKDWLGFGARSRKSPAAATHPTGTWRVRENQLSGKVLIDKKENKLIEDLSNRQGIKENIYFQLFLKIIDCGLAEFERYRQSIIRKINLKNIDEEKDFSITNLILKNPNQIINLPEESVNNLVLELKDFKKQHTEFKKKLSEKDEEHKYDMRILNVLATSGLKATSIAHEINNDRNAVENTYNSIINAMKKYDIWNFLNQEQQTKYSYLNVPYLLKRGEYINKKILVFMDTLLLEVEKNQFKQINQNIYTNLENIKQIWERDYAWIKIKIQILNSPIFFKLSEDTLQVIFDNLILNSIQQNPRENTINITIKVAVSNNNKLEIEYFDDGKGLDKKYLDTPEKILEVHETSRKNGHGLGMWIINNTIKMSGGNITTIYGNNGFYIRFLIGDKYNG